MNNLRLFPRSLRQLVLLAFLLVLLPLLFLAYQAYQSLDSLSAQAVAMNDTTLADSQRSEAMTNIGLSMERSYRQYCVVVESSLDKLYQSQRQQYITMLKEHLLTVPGGTKLTELKNLLGQMNQLNCDNGQPTKSSEELLQDFAKANVDMGQFTRTLIFARGEQLQKSIANRGEFLGRQSLILFIVSLALVVLFTHMIIGPVARVKEMINQLGAGEPLKDLQIFSGPREIRALAQRIIWLSERLSWLESQRHEFLRHLSHELKTPLASMREGTELLADEVVGTLSEGQKEVVTILNDSSRHLQQLIEQLLDYNRKLADISAEKKWVDLELAIKTVITANSLLVRAKSMSIESRLDVTQCWAESVLLMRVIDNIYSNAVHYGAEFGTIWVKSYRQGASIHIDIANSGEPIPEQEQSMLFEPFFQGARQRKGVVKGSGLGLSIARDCIQKMQGELTLVSVDYADVCFRISLPVEMAENE